MNSFVNLLSLFVLIPLLLFSVYVGMDIPIDSFGITGSEIPYQYEVFYIGTFICSLFHGLRSVKRWTALKIANKTSQFKWSALIGEKRRKRVVTYLGLEVFLMLCLSIAFISLCDSSISLFLILILSAIDSFIFIIYGKNKYRISLSSKAIIIADREVKVIYFKGLRKLSIHQQSVFFDYIEDLQLFFPLNALEEQDVSIFFNELNKLIDRERVYLGNTHKFIKNQTK